MPDVVVHLDDYASPQEVDAVRDTLLSSGLVGDVGVGIPPEPEPEEEVGNGFFWLVVVVVGVPMLPFIRQLGTRAADDAYDALKSFVGRLREARQSAKAPDGWVEFEDPDGTRLMVGEAAEDAFEKLRDVDLEARRGERLRWDEQTREWVPY